MHLSSRAFLPVLLAVVFALAGCQTVMTLVTRPPATASALRTVQPVALYLAQIQAHAGLTAVQVPDGMLYLHAKPILTRADLTDAAALTNRKGQHFVGLRFTAAGMQKLASASRQNVGSMLALVIGSELVGAPRITSPLEGGMMAFAAPSAAAAAELAARIRGDAAP